MLLSATIIESHSFHFVLSICCAANFLCNFSLALFCLTSLKSKNVFYVQSEDTRTCMMFDRGYKICMVAAVIGYPHVRDVYLFLFHAL